MSETIRAVLLIALGGVATAWYQSRIDRNKQVRSWMINAAEEYLAAVKPAYDRIGEAYDAKCEADLDELAEAMRTHSAEGIRAIGRIQLLFGPSSSAAVCGEELCYRLTFLISEAQHAFRTGSSAREVEKTLDNSLGHIESYYRRFATGAGGAVRSGGTHPIIGNLWFTTSIRTSWLHHPQRAKSLRKVRRASKALRRAEAELDRAEKANQDSTPSTGSPNETD